MARDRREAAEANKPDLRCERGAGIVKVETKKSITSGRKLAYWLIGGVVAVFGLNYLALDMGVQNKLGEDSRNSGISVHVYYEWLVNPQSIVIDIWSIEESSTSMADVDRVLLQTAAHLQDREYSKVVLAYNGEHRFLLEGEYFGQLGREYGIQNSIYTIRTLAENVYKMDGRSAFPTWTGGLLGVLSKQMEDHQKFHEQWYLDDL